MKHYSFKTFLLSGLALLAWIFSTSVSAGCVGNDDPSEIVTEYGGSTLSCPSGLSGVTIDDIIPGAKSGIIDEGTGFIKITAIIDGIVSWAAVGDDNTVETFDSAFGIDAIITDVATGANGCFLAYGEDQFEGEAGFFRENGSSLTTRAISFCTDGIKEEITVVPPLAKVEQCILANGQSKEIHGVTFSCDANLVAGEVRTIIVTKDTAGNCGVVNGEIVCDPVPGHGFLDVNGNIDFNNVCQCVGISGDTGLPDPNVLRVECDPDPNATTNKCVSASEDIPVVITIENPRCFWIGGFARCF